MDNSIVMKRMCLTLMLFFALISGDYGTFRDSTGDYGQGTLKAIRLKKIRLTFAPSKDENIE